MGMHDSSLLHLIQKFRSLMSFNSSPVSCGFETMDKTRNTCHLCETKSDLLKYHCRSCGSQFCESCHFKENIGSCKLCSEFAVSSKSGGKWSGKVYPSESPKQSPNPPSPSFSGDSQSALTQSIDVSSSNYSSHDSFRCSTSRTNLDEGEQSTSHIFNAPIEYIRSVSDLDSSSVVSAGHEFYNSVSLGTLGASNVVQISSSQVGLSVQNPNPTDCEPAVLEKPADPQPLHFETNGLIWFPPPPEDEDDEIEDKLLTYDDEDDDVGDSGFVFSPTDNIGTVFSDKERRDFDHKEAWRDAVEGHFRALVSQLLQGEGISDCGEDWVDIVTAISWKAAKFIKPNTSRGGSMDPCDYLKVKCVASGNRNESKLIRGVVCTKNIKHKRMMSQYKNARLLLLGGSLEYQRVPNQLASFETLLQQENNHLKTVVSKIEAHRPNVLLVEKSVSSIALEHLLAKEISLVLNVKRPLLEMIAKCSGASIIPSTEHISAARLGHCEIFRLEKVTEEHEPVNKFKKKPMKTLMFFEGCPRRLGCTVLLRGSYHEELKKVKHVVQYAVFAAYHLSRETSFLADEGAGLPTSPVKSLPFSPEEITFYSVNPPSSDLNLELGLQESLSELSDSNQDDIPTPDEFRYREALCEACDENLALDEVVGTSKTNDAEYFSDSNIHQSILVSFSSHCMASGTVCERSRTVRLKFYGPSDKPLGRYLRDDLFDQRKKCRSCKESAGAHVVCYTHQHANLTINVKHLPSVKLPGEKDGKIWMWHRCLRCVYVDGVPPSTRRVVMSDAAWGLSFGKFLELSFSSHTTGNRVASCGHSLQRDCLRFYGFGSMVAFFRYSPINIHYVRLPPSILEFTGPSQETWMRNEKNELLSKAGALHTEVSCFLEELKIKSSSFVNEFSDANELHDHILDLNVVISNEKSYYEDLLQPNIENPATDIFEINRLRHSLLIGSRVWDRRLYLLDNLVKSSAPSLADSSIMGKKGSSLDLVVEDDDVFECSKSDEDLNEVGPFVNEGIKNGESDVITTSLERILSEASILSDRIDSAWSGADLGPSVRRLMRPTRVYSFDSAQRLQQRIQKELFPSSLYLSNLRSFHASRGYRHMIRDPVAIIQMTHLPMSQSVISSVPSLPQGSRFMVTSNSKNDTVFTVYENEPSSVISYALGSKQYDDWVAYGTRKHQRGSSFGLKSKVNSGLSIFPSSGSLDLDYAVYENHASENLQTNSPHVRISFEDEPATSGGAGRAKFSVMCYFVKEFDSLRTKCCPSKVDFLRSLSRCKRWSAQGGKSNVYFAKTFDDRFIIKQVTKTELDSFEDFASEYFKYMTDAVSSGSPTCLAKVLGIYQVTVKHLKGGKEVRMDLMVMENIFFGRSISKVYDLKGSARSRYNPDNMGADKVLLDMNLLETLRTNPIFLGSKAKRILERAVWNDTSFLASVDVMDYSLLVGVDEDGKELVLGIIDFMRQYTWDKHLETWVKASGILGGPKNESPTIISPKQYKKRFRKAMTTYFLTVPS